MRKVPADAKRPPGPDGWSPLGVLREARRDPLGLVLDLRHRYGDVVRLRMGHKRLLLVSEPALIGHVLKDNYQNYRKGLGLVEARRWLGNGLATSDGEDWRRQRIAMGPAFRRDKVLEFLPIMSAETQRMLDRWATVAQRGERIDVASDIMALTLAVITRSMFGGRLRQADEVRRAFETTVREAMAEVTSLVPVPTWVPTPSHRRFRSAHRTLVQAVDLLIEEHQAGAVDSLLLSVIIDAHPDGIDPHELRDQVVTILQAGHETTALTIAWALYLLGANPAVAEALHDETVAVADMERSVAGGVGESSLSRGVLEESLRLYPPLWMLTRRANAPDTLGDYDIEADADILISPYVMHRHPDYWEEPDAFRPHRFLRGQATDRAQFTYMPFGAGPRSCIGHTFAMMEGALIIGLISRSFRLHPEPRYPVVPEALLTLRFKHGLVMKPVLA